MVAGLEDGVSDTYKCPRCNDVMARKFERTHKVICLALELRHTEDVERLLSDINRESS